MAEIGSGYGGGGAGGGERAAENFTTSSAGADGRIQLIMVPKNITQVNSRFKVAVGGNTYTVQNARSRYMNTGAPFSTATTTVGKLSYSTAALVTSRERYYGFYTTNRTQQKFIIQAGPNGIDTAYREIASISGLKSGIGRIDSKLVNGGIPLSVLYRTNDQPFTYQGAFYYGTTTGIVNGEITKDYPSNYIVEASSTAGLDVYAIMQAAGGGGGGADNSWGLFNYAAGGGGGGGGGAAFVRISVPAGAYSLAFRVGAGGAGGASRNGQADNGTKGGDTKIILYQGQGGDTRRAEVTVTGGGGGGGAKDTSYGNGGAKGQYTLTYDPNGYVTNIAIVDGGNGGGGYGASTTTGGAVTTSGTWSTTSVTDAFDATISASNTFGSGGSTGSQDDRGGGGGASWLGNGGHYGL